MSWGISLLQQKTYSEIFHKPKQQEIFCQMGVEAQMAKPMLLWVQYASKAIGK